MMTTQKKKPLPGQHRKVGPLTEKVEPIMAPHPQLEVLQERMNHLATREQMNATTAQMNKLHGEAMARMDQMATRDEMNATVAQMNKLHGEAMERINQIAGQMATKDEMNATVAQMNKLHGEAMERINQTAATVEVLRERTSHMVTRAEMQELRSEFMDRIGRVETCMGEVKSELKLIRWIGGALGIAIIAGLVRIIFFPVV